MDVLDKINGQNKDIIKKIIDDSGYWVKTFVLFKVIPSKIVKQILDEYFAAKDENKFLTKIDGVVYKFYYLSVRDSVKGKGFSLYLFANIRGKSYILRISNHWSDSFCSEDIKDMHCGNIGSSYWAIDADDSDLLVYRTKYHDNTLKLLCGGITPLSKFIKL